MGRHSKRDSVLDTAENLFSKQGFTATGINQITEQAGVASMTLYNNFKNKGELVVATLERRSDRLLLDIENEVDKQTKGSPKRILAVFDALSFWITEELNKPQGFTGCMFLKAVHEYGSEKSAERAVALKHKQDIVDLFERELKVLNFSDFKLAALSLQLLVDGAISQAQLLKDNKSVYRAKQLAKLILVES